MGFLFVDYKGNQKVRHSYSAGQEFDRNPYLFYLRRIVGWGEKDTKAALLFGRALESAIQFFHENNGAGGVEEFDRDSSKAVTATATSTPACSKQRDMEA